MTLDKDSRILIVDDSPSILALMKDMLTAKGYKHVRTATNVEEGVDAMEKEEPDVVFLDLMMPESSGLDFSKKVQEKNPKIRIVVTTALPPTHESVVMAVSQGAVEYLQKPLQQDSVSKVLDHLEPEGEEPQGPPPHDVSYM